MKLKYLSIYLYLTLTISTPRPDYLAVSGYISRDIKQTWRIINNIINTKNPKVKNTIKKIIHDDVVYVDSEDIANMFNDCFDDIGRNIAESILESMSIILITWLI